MYLLQNPAIAPAPSPGLIGSFSIDDGESSRNATFKMNSRFLIFVASIPIHRKCQMWANFPGVNYLETALKFRNGKKNSSSLVYGPPQNLKLGIFTWQLYRDGKEKKCTKKALCAC